MKLKDKVAIITGSGSGMGKETAKTFLREGAKVVVTDINPDRVEEVTGDFSNPDNVLGVVADVSDRDSVRKLFENTLEKFGKFDILVNNAGIMDGMEPIGEISEERFDQVQAVNVKSLVYTMQFAVNYWMENQIKGCIVNTLSIGGLGGGRAGAAYTASKYAGVGLTKNTAVMYRDENIRCNAVAPGGISTNISESMMDLSEFGAGRVSASNQNSPDPGESWQVAEVIAFLASEKASYITGQVLAVDGGITAI